MGAPAAHIPGALAPALARKAAEEAGEMTGSKQPMSLTHVVATTTTGDGSIVASGVHDSAVTTTGLSYDDA